MFGKFSSVIFSLVLFSGYVVANSADAQAGCTFLSKNGCPPSASSKASAPVAKKAVAKAEVTASAVLDPVCKMPGLWYLPDNATIRVDENLHGVFSGSGITANVTFIQSGLNAFSLYAQCTGGGDECTDTSGTFTISSANECTQGTFISARVAGDIETWYRDKEVFDPNRIAKVSELFPEYTYTYTNGGTDVYNQNGTLVVIDGKPTAAFSAFLACCGIPVNTAVGSMWHAMVDFVAKGRTAATALISQRSYIADVLPPSGDFGKNWFHAWEEKLMATGNGGDLFYIDENGAPWIFKQDADGSFISPPSSFMTLEALTDRYLLTKKGNLKHSFSNDASIAPPGAITEIAEPHGEKILFTYANGKLASVETALAGKVLVARNTLGLVSSLTRARDNLVYTYEYSPDSRLISSRDPENRTTRYEYNSDGKMSAITDPVSRQMTFHYDSVGRMAYQTEIGDAYRGFRYQENADGTRITWVRETNGQTTQYFFDAKLKLTKKVNPDGGVEEFTNNADYQVVAKKDALGQVTTFTYDDRGNLASTKAPIDPSPTRMTYDPVYDVPTSVTPLASAPVAFNLNPLNGDRLKISRVTAAKTLALMLGNDPFGNILNRTNTAASYADVRDANGLLVQAFDARNPEIRSYDVRARLVKRSFANGRVLTYTYDNLDRIVGIADSHGPSTAMTYDAVDRVTEKRVTADGTTQTTRYVWDERDRLVSLTNALGETTEWSYDEFSSRDGHAVTLPNPTSMTDAKGRVTRYTYDSMDRLGSTIDPSGAETRMRYDLRGDMSELEDDAHRITRFAYDANRRMIRRERPVALGQGSTNRSATEVTVYAYDFDGKLVREESYSDAATSGEHQITEIAYDAFDRMIAKKLSRKKGTAAAVVDENATYRYADLLEASQRTGADNEVAKLSFTFEAVPPFKATAYAVSATSSSNPFGIPVGSFSLKYDPSGDVSELKRGTQTLYTKAYDPAGRLARVAAGGSGLKSWSTDMTYDGFGRPKLRKDVGGITESLTYDSLNRIQNLAWKQGSKTLVSEELGYDTVGNITKLEREDFAANLGYDSRDQLTSMASKRTGITGSGIIAWLLSKAPLPSALSQEFAYDSVGNRTASEGAPNASYLENQIVSDKNHKYVSDSDGLGRLVLETDTRTNLQKRFAYRADGRLVGFEKTFDEDHDADYDPKDPILTKATYAYDALGRRIAKKFERNCRRFKRSFNNSFAFLGEEDRIIVGRDGSSNEFLYVDGQGIDEHLAVVSKFEAKSYLTDHLGSVLNGEAAGGIQAFGPYGETLGLKLPIFTLSDPVKYGFTGRSYDSESGIYYYRARMYNPGTGRFLQKDPIGFSSGDENLYRYVSNRPLGFIDPSGLAQCNYRNSSKLLSCISNDGKTAFVVNAVSGVPGSSQSEENGPIPVGSYEIRKLSGSIDGTHFVDPGFLSRILYKFGLVRGGFNIHLPGHQSNGCITAQESKNDTSTIKSLDSLLLLENGENSLNVLD